MTEEMFEAAVDAEDWRLAAMIILAHRLSVLLTRDVFINELWRVAFFDECPDDVKDLVTRAWRLVRAMEMEL
jgi:hypothetical protein